MSCPRDLESQAARQHDTGGTSRAILRYTLFANDGDPFAETMLVPGWQSAPSGGRVDLAPGIQ
jgi:hypothetical protein